MMRGRGRGAAGARGAGAARAPLVPALMRPPYRRYPPDVSGFCNHGYYELGQEKTGPEDGNLDLKRSYYACSQIKGTD